MRVAAQLGIEDAAEHAHGVKVIHSKLFGHEIDFFHADPVLARDAPAEFNAFGQDVVAGLKSAPDLVRISFIVEDERMNIAVACVKDVGNSELIFAAAFADELHDLRQLRAWHHAILGDEVGAKSPDGAEGSLP